MSQADLAAAIGMARETVGAMERGQAPIELRTDLAIRFVTMPLAFGNRTTEVIAGQALDLATTLVENGKTDDDDLRQAQTLGLEWLNAGGSDIGHQLLIALQIQVNMLENGWYNVALMDHAKAELALFIKAWKAIMPVPDKE